MNKKPINCNPTKEFFQLLKTIEKTTKNQAKIKSYNPDDISSFVVEICPKKGLYQFAKFLFQIQLVSYPREFPNVICLSDIYHPNIEHGEGYHNVCLNLFDNWNRSFGLIDVIQGLIFLLYQPNLSDPISSFFNSKNTNDDVFRKNVYTSLHGGTVDGIDFLPNPGICEYHNDNLSKKQLAIDKEATEPDENEILIIEKKVMEEKDECEEIVEEKENYVAEVIETKEEKESLEEINTMMTNNNAAQLFHNVDDDNEQSQESVTEKSECNSEDDEQHLPVREVISPNAFYSDLICSRYAQPDIVSDSEYDSSEIWDASIICDNFGFPSSSYVSGGSDFDGNIDCYFRYVSDDYEDASGNEDEDFEFQSDYHYISVPSNHNDPSYIFLKKWVDLRKSLNMTSESPKPLTTIVLTDVLNPFRNIFSTFVLCSETENDNNWRRYYDKAVYRVNRNDQMLHWMIWGQNISRWALNRAYKLPMLDWGFDSVIWYSIFVGLSYKINQRLCEIYNCKTPTDFVCLFLK